MHSETKNEQYLRGTHECTVRRKMSLITSVRMISGGLFIEMMLDGRTRKITATTKKVRVGKGSK